MRGGLCESISKIIHFTVATHFSLPRPIMALSGEGDRAGCAGARGRFCLICHQHPGDPHPLSCPLPAHSSIFLPIHGRTSVQLNGSRMNRRKWENHWISRPKTRCKSERSRREMISSTNWKFTPAFLFKLHQTKIKNEQGSEVGNPCRSRFVNSQIQIDYCVVLSNPGM